jgi:hypothetical protein
MASASRKTKCIPPPPRESASDEAKAAYYERHDPVDLLDAGYLEEDGLFEGERRLVDLRPERGLVVIPIDAGVARRLWRLAKGRGQTPSHLASDLLAADLAELPRRRKTG